MEVWLWVALAVAFGVLEAMTAGLISIWFVAGAVAALIAAMLQCTLVVQIWVFIIVSALALLITRPFIKKLRPQGTPVPTNADRVVGMPGVVTQEVADIASPPGAVRADGKEWTAYSESGEHIPAGTSVIVERLEGVKLFVRPESAA